MKEKNEGWNIVLGIEAHAKSVLGGSSRGSHIHAYKDLPSSWACKDEWKEREAILGKKGWHDQSQGQGKRKVQVMFRVWNFKLEKRVGT